MMSATTIQPPPTASPPAGIGPRPLAMRWTVEQFNQMGSMGWFEGRRPFLLDGVIWEQGPMNPLHANALYLMAEAVRAIFATGWVVRVQLPMRVDEYDDPFPDLLIVAGGPRDFWTAHPVTASLIVEVSDTTLNVDVTEKAERYATANVADYWVLDLNSRKLLVSRDPVALPTGLGATAYRTQLPLNPTDRVSPLAAPHASILVADLLP
jgi:Uma2 family endonuclease